MRDPGLQEVALTQACVLPAGGARMLQLVVAIQDADLARFQVAGRSGEDDAQGGVEWTVHASGAIRLAASAPPPPVLPEAIEAACSTHTSGDAYYQIADTHGLSYGPS